MKNGSLSPLLAAYIPLGRGLTPINNVVYILLYHLLFIASLSITFFFPIAMDIFLSLFFSFSLKFISPTRHIHSFLKENVLLSLLFGNFLF